MLRCRQQLDELLGFLQGFQPLAFEAHQVERLAQTELVLAHRHHGSIKGRCPQEPLQSKPGLAQSGGIALGASGDAVCQIVELIDVLREAWAVVASMNNGGTRKVALGTAVGRQHSEDLRLKIR